jgi:ubiquinone/menaquinone biosynthesis C-methylase UbiE
VNRNLTNLIRFLMDECLPPIIRDSRWFMLPFFAIAYHGRGLRQAMDFKKLVYSWTPAQYRAFYAGLDTISSRRETDLNRACVERILGEVGEGDRNVLDVGCGNGYLLREIRRRHPGLEAVGVDLRPPKGPTAHLHVEADMERLPFPDGRFDLVTCSHTLEHCVRLPQVVQELRRVARRRVVVVVPCQRYYYYTLDEHLNFFPFREKLIHVMGLEDYRCEKLSGDWFYSGRVTAPAAGPAAER